jgi:hypothetical protein
MARSDITLNMMLDQATQIVDTSKWVIVDASSEFWIVDPRIEPTEQNNWGAVFNGISTWQDAEAIILKYNTPEEQAWRMEEARRSRRKPINSRGRCDAAVRFLRRISPADPIVGSHPSKSKPRLERGTGP